MKICATSDLHGRLPMFPECDLALIVGDVAPWEDHEHQFQYNWFSTVWPAYLETIPAKTVAWVGGNHDLILENATFQAFETEAEHIHYLGLSGDIYVPAETRDIRVWGSPFSFSPEGWAFNLRNDERKAELIYEDMPPDADIIMTHGPPIKYGGTLPDGNSAGSLALWQRVKEVRPRLHVFGHVHSNYGRWNYPPLANPPEDEPPMTLANVSYISEDGRYYHPIQTFNLHF